ncbi:MAG: cobalamin-independent methionine synthase II family protein [Chloroflexi bacterium]|nr:cobalamin-independent methionine synthase II family protein [Chloroflexota bacterium]
MKRSTERILTTHTGSLPRPKALLPLIFARERGEESDPSERLAATRQAVHDIVRAQLDAGIDVVNDGEQGKSSYATYVQNRLEGFEGEPVTPAPITDPDFPEFFAQTAAMRPGATNPLLRRPCNGPIRYRDVEELRSELDDFRTALGGVSPADTFLSAASPGIASIFIPNEYYATHEQYIGALADAMKTEYDAIHEAGFLLQIDAPDLALSRPRYFGHLGDDEFRRTIRTHVEAVNHATRDIPADRMRMHLCWGNYEGPHHRDVPLAQIVDIALEARPSGLSFEAANPRHEHEWKLWEETALPEGKVLIPGVLDSTTNYIEHPELVAERLLRFAGAVGRENVIAGTDCGFSTGAGYLQVHPSITWAKFRAMADGAAIASRELW